MSDQLLCDATTASGKACKNFSVGAANGRNFCNVVSHQDQAQKYQRIVTSHVVENAVEEEAAPEEVAASATGSLQDALEKEIAFLEETTAASFEVATEVATEVTNISARAQELLEEARGWVALAAQVCPGCGTAGKPSFWGVLSDTPDTKLICLACESRWTMAGARWRA